jgi:hypothetical protein
MMATIMWMAWLKCGNSLPAYRPRGTSSRSLSARQATAQLVPLVRFPFESDLWPSAFRRELAPSPLKKCQQECQQTSFGGG